MGMLPNHESSAHTQVPDQMISKPLTNALESNKVLVQRAVQL